MRRGTFAGLVLVGMSIATVAAAKGPYGPNLSATVKTLSPTSRVVHITNRDQVTYRTFIVQTWNTPKIVGAKARKQPCPIERIGVTIGVKFNRRYWATCEKALAPGKTLDIRLTTSRGSGRIEVLVVAYGETFGIRR